jgi:hypothetical protein
MSNSTPKKQVIAIDDDLINRAITAIDSTEPTPEEREAELLAKLIPAIRIAMDRGESDDKIGKKVKFAIPGLHYTKLKALLAAAAKLPSKLQDQADLSNQSLEDSQ